MMALLLITLGRLLNSLKSCASRQSMSYLFQRPAATMGAPV